MWISAGAGSSVHAISLRARTIVWSRPKILCPKVKSCRPLFYPLLGPCLFSAHTHAACVATTHENNTCELVTLRLVLFFCWRWLCGRINVNRALPTGYVLERWWVNDLQWFWSADFKSVGEFEKPSGSIPPFTRWVFFLGGSLVFRFFVFSLTFVPLLDIWAHLARKCQVHPFFSCLVFFSFLVFFFSPSFSGGKIRTKPGLLLRVARMHEFICAQMASRRAVAWLHGRCGGWIDTYVDGVHRVGVLLVRHLQSGECVCCFGSFS